MRKQAMIQAHKIASFHNYSVDFGSCLKAAWNLVKSGKTFGGEKMYTARQIEIEVAKLLLAAGLNGFVSHF